MVEGELRASGLATRVAADFVVSDVDEPRATASPDTREGLPVRTTGDFTEVLVLPRRPGDINREAVLLSPGDVDVLGRLPGSGVSVLLAPPGVPKRGVSEGP